jgi:hypothetical protein
MSAPPPFILDVLPSDCFALIQGHCDSGSTHALICASKETLSAVLQSSRRQITFTAQSESGVSQLPALLRIAPQHRVLSLRLNLLGDVGVLRSIDPVCAGLVQRLHLEVIALV